MEPDSDAIVVGAGITGLATAFALVRQGRRVEVLEAGDRAGGVIGTRRTDGALWETGPNSILETTPRIGELLAALGIAGERVDPGPDAALRNIVRDGRLVPLPTSPPALLATRAFTLNAKLRLCREPFVAPAPPEAEETIAAFTRRRLGAEFLDYAIEPFVAGVYAGDAERISVPAAFPRLHALEQRYGSLIKGQILGARERRRLGEPARNAAPSFSFKAGLQTLTDALAQAVASISLRTRVGELQPTPPGRWAIRGERDGVPFVRHSRAVVLAVPAGAAAKLLASQARDAAAALDEIEYAPVAVVASVYRRADIAHPLAGFGFLVPRVERRRVLGTLFSSSMYPNRAPEGHVTLTSFVGGLREPALVDLDDTALAALVHADLTALVGASGPPVLRAILRWPRAIPQYTLGHAARIARLERVEAALPGLFVRGSFRGGVAVGDCIRNAAESAADVARYLD